MRYRDRITMSSGKRGGQPTIRGMRIAVYDVLKLLASGMTERQILKDFPELTHEDIQAVLAYAAEREHAATTSHEAPARSKPLTSTR